MTPDISVVMGVYNGAASLAATVDSILSQQDVSLEFVIVNDGSTDQTPQILEEYAGRDSRVTLLKQENQGLTMALINGCAAAKGRYIARQDAGDTSLTGRLSKQLEVLSSNTDASFISCGTRFIGPEREPLYEVLPGSSDLTQPLLTLSLDKIEGPSMHGCTMFPREKYQQVGGYRASFHFAQDLDLWIRMAECGRHIAIKEILYEARITVGAISSRYRKEQVESARIILESAQRRRNELSDDDLLQKASAIKPDAKTKVGRLERANALYFIGACLRESHSPRAPRYFQRALLAYPLHLRSALRLLMG
jgi:hypothetical protein